MNLAYFTVQFVPDPIRAEGRNVAVIGTAGGQGYVRAAGLNAEGRLDMAEIRAVAGLSVTDSMAIPDWIDYFQCVAEHDATTRESLARELATLGTTFGPFVVGAEGTAEIGARETPETVIDRVFDRVVGRPPAELVDRFPERLQWLLRVTELPTLADFHRDPEIELNTPAGAVTLRFHMALVGAPAVAFRIVRYRGTDAEIGREVRAALAQFERAWSARFLSAGRSVVLTDRRWPEGRFAKLLARKRIAVINVFDDDAVQRVRAVLNVRLRGNRA